jgi:hypothetical protein
MESEYPAARRELQMESLAAERLVATQPTAAGAELLDAPALLAFRPFPSRSFQ